MPDTVIPIVIRSNPFVSRLTSERCYLMPRVCAYTADVIREYWDVPETAALRLLA